MAAAICALALALLAAPTQALAARRRSPVRMSIAVWKSTSGALRHRSDAVLAQWLISTQVDRAERCGSDDERPPREDGLFVCGGVYQTGHDARRRGIDR